MQDVSNIIWETYDDTHGYATEKIEKNNSVSIDNEENFWFFWGQFDHINQRKMLDMVSTISTDTYDFIRSKI